MSRGRERRDGRDEQEKDRLSEQRDRITIRGSSEEVALDRHASEERSAEEGDDERQRRRGGVVLAIGEVVRRNALSLEGIARGAGMQVADVAHVACCNHSTETRP